jgi:ferredoxin
VDVSVDSSKCQGHARCNLICPEIFDLDDDGYVKLLTPHVAPEYEVAAKDAVANCPERAISIA